MDRFKTTPLIGDLMIALDRSVRVASSVACAWATAAFALASSASARLTAA
jgi:hypothetical protein